ncbi:tetratricopeptide repeat protein [Alkalicaulis satelles]|nr:tetratricopeptide repeat protein [Alkalicaulis satelles]
MLRALLVLALAAGLAACAPSGPEAAPEAAGGACADAPGLMADSRFADAQAAYEACLAFSDHDWEEEAELRLRLAASLMGQEHFADALSVYDALLELIERETGDGAHPAVRRNRAMALLRLGRHEDALDDARTALMRSPRDVTAHMIAGSAQLETGDAAGAAGSFDAALALNPDSAAALSGRSAAFAALGRHDAALDDALEAVSFAPDGAGALNALCWALVKAGRAQEALPTCDAALEMRPDSGAITHSRAAALEQLGRMDEARDLYARAHELDPASREIAADYARTRRQ